MNFDDSIQYLYNLGNEVLAMKLGLENIGKLLDALGKPQNNYLKIQIAGTNGKGSTCAFLEAICLSAGIQVGMTTSPHLISVTERIRINGAEISEEDFARHATVIRETSEKLVESGELETVPTYFEQVTAIALNAFAESKVELAILETGLGGRFDATTAAKAEIVAITPIDYDHQRILGDTLAEIAAEKAAIIRADTKVIVAPQKTEAEKVILGKCREVGVEPIIVSEDFLIKKHNLEINEPIIAVNFSTENDVYHDIVFGLPGKHQIVNALVAVNLAETLRDFGFEIEKENIWTGLEKARHRGRLEFYEGILFDGAHNASGARALREYLDEFIKQPVVLIFGAMRDKDLSEIAEVLFPKADRLILTGVENQRSMTAEELSEFVPHNFDKNNVIIVQNAREALQTARNIASNKELICVTGSLYLIGEAQKILSENVL
ncbi:MAG TPA: Mur ligase family protein [Pyrinomonadaceae bacterium]|nr:Mur ligase family protein [Pyrinomonadaceae bacterium]